MAMSNTKTERQLSISRLITSKFISLSKLILFLSELPLVLNVTVLLSDSVLPIITIFGIPISSQSLSLFPSLLLGHQVLHLILIASVS